MYFEKGLEAALKARKREAEGSAEKHETGGHDAGGTGRGREGGRGGLDVDRKSRDRCRNYVPDPFARHVHK